MEDKLPKMVKSVIYVLIDPRNDKIRYVGKTNQSVKARIASHMRDTGNCHRVNWLKELKAKGLKPDYKIIEKIETREVDPWPWQESERYWIAKFKSMGANLTNNTSGGDGVCDLPKETRNKMASVWKGRKHTPETIEKLKAARAKRIITEETKKRIGKAHKGRKITWIDKISAANRKLDSIQVEVIKARLKSGEGTCALANEYSVHRTTISKIKMGTYHLPYRRNKITKK